MTTAQAALKGLERCLEFTQSQCDNNTSFYSKGIEQLVQIRELSERISYLANEALSKVGLQYSSDKNSAIVLSELEEIKSQINAIAISSSVSNQSVIVQINNKDIQNSDSSTIIATNQNDLDKPRYDTPNDKLSKPQIGSFIREFKNVLMSVDSLPEEFFSTRIPGKQCAHLCYKYFATRFSKQNPCIFKPEEFQNYLISIILKFSDAYMHKDIEDFVIYFDSWLDSLSSCNQKYTLPKDIATIYFNVVNEKTKKSDYSMSSETLKCFKELWSELWTLGYHNFSKMDYAKFVPEETINWIDAIPVYQSFSQNDVLDDIIWVSDKWCSFSRFESYDLCRFIVNEQKQFSYLDHYEDLGLSQSEIYQALLNYVKHNGNNALVNLKHSVNSILAVLDYSEFEISNNVERLDYLKNQPLNSLDIIDVLDEYNYECKE